MAAFIKPIPLDYSALWEALKEPARLLLMALAGWGISQLANTDQTLTVAIVTILLRTADKVLHQFGKDNEMDKLSKGLTGWLGV